MEVPSLGYSIIGDGTTDESTEVHKRSRTANRRAFSRIMLNLTFRVNAYIDWPTKFQLLTRPGSKEEEQDVLKHSHQLVSAIPAAQSDIEARIRKSYSRFCSGEAIVVDFCCLRT